MKVIWKRPDGFLGASPQDYTVVEVANNSRIWLHKQDNVNFPFRVSGGWQDEDATKRLNRLVNLIDKGNPELLEHLLNDYYESNAEDGAKYIAELISWLDELKSNLKGDHWETAIMTEVMAELHSRVKASESEFLKSSDKPD